MSDYIKREDAERLLRYYFLSALTEDERVDELNRVPSADVVEVVRCKDCKHWLPHTQCGFDEDNNEYHDYCGCHMPLDDFEAEYWDANDYCNYGEKKE